MRDLHGDERGPTDGNARLAAVDVLSSAREPESIQVLKMGVFPSSLSSSSQHSLGAIYLSTCRDGLHGDERGPTDGNARLAAVDQRQRYHGEEVLWLDRLGLRLKVEG